MNGQVLLIELGLQLGLSDVKARRFGSNQHPSKPNAIQRARSPLTTVVAVRIARLDWLKGLPPVEADCPCLTG